MKKGVSKYLGLETKNYKVVDFKHSQPTRCIYKVLNKEKGTFMWIPAPTMRKITLGGTTFERVEYFRNIGGRKNTKE